MNLVVERPAWLFLLVLAIPVAWTALRWFASMSVLRRLSALVLRVALIAIIAGTLAGVSVVRQTERLGVIAVIDVSGSVRRFAGEEVSPTLAAREFLRRANESRRPDDHLGVVVFAGRAMAIALPSAADITNRPFEVDLPEGTDLAGALRLAAALIPPAAAGRLVLFSDANATTGDPIEAALEIAGRSGVGDTARQAMPIDVVLWSYDVDSELIVEQVDVPPRAPEQSTVTVRVALRATDATTGTLLLLRDGVPMDINGDAPGAGRRLALPPGRHVELIQVELDAGRIHPFEAVFEPDSTDAGSGPVTVGDTLLENNRAEAFTITPGKGRVLMLDGVDNGRPGTPGATLADALRRSGIDVVLTAPAGAPGGVLGYQDYDLVILQNVPADSLGPATQEALSAYVRDLGGGLVMVGGPDSFGAGGWRGTPVEDILPVRLDLPESLVTPEAAIVFVIDSSGSMARSVLGSARSQQSIANEATALAIRTLDQKDLVGVISFNNSYDVVVPLAPNEDPERTGARVKSIGAGGGTRLGPALAEAGRQLNRVDAKIKHIIILSDGRSQDEGSLPPLAEQLHADDINISTISVGDQVDLEIMSRIAEVGGGEWYQVLNPNVLPQIFLKAVRVVRKPLVREGAFSPVILPTGSELTAGIDQTPPLTGLVLTQARDEPTVTYAMTHPAGEPLLAHWPVELGRVAAFTSDAHQWSQAWLDWPGYQQFWTQLARVISRPAATSPHELTIDKQGDEITLRIAASDDEGRPIDMLGIDADIYSPDGDKVTVTLTQTAPGTYEATVPATDSGNYVAIVKPRQGTTQLTPIIGGTSIAAGREFRTLRSNDALMLEIARQTGGRVLDIDDPAPAIFDREGLAPTRARVPIWRSLLIWAVIIMLLDVGTRRVAWDRLISRQFGADLRRMAAEATEARGDRAGRTLSSLRVKGRAEVGAKALGEDDAANVAVAASAQRRKARQERLVQMREQLKEQGEGAPIVRDKPKAAAAGGAGGLLAAKRRARERYGDMPEDDA